MKNTYGYLSSLGVVLGVALLSQPALAEMNLIEFEDLAAFTQVTNQYSSLGVTFSGAFAVTCGNGLDCSVSPPYSGVNSLQNDPFSGGVTRIDFGPEAGSVMSASVRITGLSVIYLEAYNSVGALMGSAQTLGANYLPVGTPNELLSVASTTDPIAYVLIHDGGSSFNLDDFAFESTVVVTLTYLEIAVKNLSDAAYIPTKKVKSSRSELLHKVAELEKAIKKNKSLCQIREKIQELRDNVLKRTVAGAEQTALLAAIDQFALAY